METEGFERRGATTGSRWAGPVGAVAGVRPNEEDLGESGPATSVLS